MVLIKNTDKMSDKMKNLSKRMKILKKMNILESKNTFSKLLTRLNDRLDTTEEMVSKLEETATETIQKEPQTFKIQAKKLIEQQGALKQL